MGAPDPRADVTGREALRDRHREGPEILGIPAAAAIRRFPGVANEKWPIEPIDRFLLAQHGREAADAGRRCRPPQLDPPRHLRPDRTAADAGGDRRVREGSRRRTPSPRSSTGCSPRRTSANAGAGTGSTSRATPNPPAADGTSRSRTPGATAITSSTRSTRTSRSTASSASRSPATCCPPRPHGSATSN